MDFPLSDADVFNFCPNGEVVEYILLIHMSQRGVEVFNFPTMAWGGLNSLERQSVTDGFLPFFPSLPSSFPPQVGFIHREECLR